MVYECVKGRMQKMKEGKKRAEKRLLTACVFLAVTGILMVCARQLPGFAEWYAVHIYGKLTAVIGRVAGLASFSIVESALYAVLVLIPVSGVCAAVQAIRAKQGIKPGLARMLEWASGLFLAVSVLLFLYTANCGVNYQRESFSQKAGLDMGQYTSEELKQVCEWLTEEVNARAGLESRNEDGEMVLKPLAGNSRRAALAESAIAAMENLTGEYQDLKGYYPRPKPVCVSEILSYQGLSGVYSPFTIEANYNADMPDYNIPFTLCHELSHLRGFMQEEEANFIAFLACSQSEDKDFQYSGYLTAWVYSMNALRRAAAEEWQEIRGELRETAEADLRENSRFWDAYDGAVAVVSDLVNDTYLKANGQSEGVQSYGRMVDLLIAYVLPEAIPEPQSQP